jgi:hypothetical protein
MLPVMLPVMLVASKISKHKKRAAAKPDKPNNLDRMPIAVASSTQNKKSYQIPLDHPRPCLRDEMHQLRTR